MKYDVHDYDAKNSEEKAKHVNIEKKSEKAKESFRFLSEETEKLSDVLTEAYKKMHENKKISLGEEEISEDFLEESYKSNNMIRSIFAKLKMKKEKLGEKLIKYTNLGSFAAVEILLKNGADPNSYKNKFDPKKNLLIKHTVLRVAICKGDLEMTQLLLDYGADINFILEKNRTYLYLAAFHQDFAMTNLLLKNGINSAHLDYRKQNFVEYFHSVYFRRNTKKEQKEKLEFNQEEKLEFLMEEKLVINCEAPQKQGVFPNFFQREENQR